MTVAIADGVKYLADSAGAYWLIDEIAIVQPYEPSVAREEFQVWKLKVNADDSAELTCGDGNNNIVVTKQISFTDFPLPEITLWFTDNTILLPSEY